MIVHSFDQYRVINFLYFSSFSFFNLINKCHTKRRIATNEQAEIIFLSQVSESETNIVLELSAIYQLEDILNHQIQNVCGTTVSTTLLISVVLTGSNVCEFHVSNSL